MVSNNFGIFPASGGLGGSTLKHLLDVIDPANLTAVMRKPQTAPSTVKESAVTIRAADYDNASTLQNAFDGISTLNLISYASIDHEHRFKVCSRRSLLEDQTNTYIWQKLTDLSYKVHKLAIDAARKSGVSHIFYSSLAFGGDCEPTSVAHVMQAHLDTEKYLAEVAAQDPSFTYTAVRIGIYSESFPIYTACFNPQSPVDEIKIPHNGSAPGIAWAKRDELGEAMAQLIGQYASSPKAFPHINKTILLSGPRSWSLNETVEVFSKLLQKPIKIQEVSVDEYASQPQVAESLTYGGGNMAAIWATAWEAIRKGETAVVTPLLAQLLGREPEAFDKTVADMV
jgi:uncharacterized protein YbjT (DUF2867 family)